MDAFHTLRVRGKREAFPLHNFELFTLLISALEWRKHNGSIKMVTDSAGAEFLEVYGLIDAWDETTILLDDMQSLNINEDVFWAGAKLYALSQCKAPCVMMDLDFILWKPIDFQKYGTDLAVIHREDINPFVYRSKEHFSFWDDWEFPDWLNWSVLPCNGAFVYFGSQEFISEYTEFAIEFMQKANEADDRLYYMVFAEQRWMAMCADYLSIPIHEFSSLSVLFGGKQKYFTHLWGDKQRLKDNLKDAEIFCRKCAWRLVHDFPDFAEKILCQNWAKRYWK